MYHRVFNTQLCDSPPLMDKKLHPLRKLESVEYVRNNGRLFIKVPIQDTGKLQIAVALRTNSFLIIYPELTKVYAFSTDFRGIGYINMSDHRRWDIPVFPKLSPSTDRSSTGENHFSVQRAYPRRTCGGTAIFRAKLNRLIREIGS